MSMKIQVANIMRVFFLPILTIPDFVLCEFYYNARKKF